MPSPCHILIEGNPALIYASRNGTPEHVMPTLRRFLNTFWQERDLSGETCDTPECLLAQIVVRFGFEICEDDYSNLRVGMQFYPDVDYLYWVRASRQVEVWVPESSYRRTPQLGLNACRALVMDAQSLA